VAVVEENEDLCGLFAHPGEPFCPLFELVLAVAVVVSKRAALPPVLGVPTVEPDVADLLRGNLLLWGQKARKLWFVDATIDDLLALKEVVNFVVNPALMSELHDQRDGRESVTEPGYVITALGREPERPGELGEYCGEPAGFEQWPEAFKEGLVCPIVCGPSVCHILMRLDDELEVCVDFCKHSRKGPRRRDAIVRCVDLGDVEMLGVEREHIPVR